MMALPPAVGVAPNGPPFARYNVGNNHPEPLLRFIDVLEQALGRTAARESLPMRPGYVRETWADITAIQGDTGFSPAKPIEQCVQKFVAWYCDYHEV